MPGNVWNFRNTLIRIIFCTVGILCFVTAQNKCGLVPSKIFLPKGEKRQLVFWTDQDYTQLTTTTASSVSSSTSQEPVDDFLLVVNGNKPGLGDRPSGEVSNETQIVEATSTSTSTSTTVDTNQEDIIFITTEQPQLGTSAEESGDDATGQIQITENVDKETTTIKLNEATTLSSASTTLSLASTTVVPIEVSTIDNLQDVSLLMQQEASTTTQDNEFVSETTSFSSLLSEEFVTEKDNQEAAPTIEFDEVELTTISLISEPITTTQKVINIETTSNNVEFPTTASIQEESTADQTTESNVQYDDSDSEDVKVEMTTNTAMPGTSSTTSSATAKESTTVKDVDIEGSSSEDAIVFPDPTLDYEFEDTTTIRMVTKEPMKDNKLTFIDDAITPVASVTSMRQESPEILNDKEDNEILDDLKDDEDDKVTVVTSMSVDNQVKEGDQLAQENEIKENVIVVTGAALPAKTWDELEVIEDTPTTEPLATTTTKNDKQKENNYFMMSLGLDTEEKEVTTESASSEDMYATSTLEVENESTTLSGLQTQEPSAETIKISSQDNNPALLTDVTTQKTDAATVPEDVQFDDADSGIDFAPETSTYFPVVNTKRILEETTTGLEVQPVFAETTTGSAESSSNYFPIAQPVIQDIIEQQDLPLISVEPVVSEIDIQDQQDTLLPIESVVVQLDIEEQQDTLLSIQPILLDTDEVIFQDTTTGSPILLPVDPVVAEIDIEEEQDILLPIEPVVADLDVQEQQDTLLPIQPILLETDEVIFQETTTGSPILSSQPLIAPVVVEAEEIDTIFEDTTMHQVVGVLKNVDTQFDTTEDTFTPAFTTAPLIVKEKEESMILSPGDIEDMVAKFAMKMTTESMIMDDDPDYDYESSTSSTNAKEQNQEEWEGSAANSVIVDVEAGKVNGPLALDKVVYYDEDQSEEDNFIDDTLDRVVTSKSLKPSLETSQEDNEERTTPGSTTVINGFIINRKTISNIIEDTETVRTGSIVDLNEINFISNQDLADESTINPTTDKMMETTTPTVTGEETTAAPSEVNTPVIDETTYDIVNSTDYEDEDNIDNSTQILLNLEDDIEGPSNLTDLVEKNITDTDTAVNEIETTSKKPAPFPVTDLLKGIYKLIQGYIPTQADPDPSVDSVVTEKVSLNPQRLEYFDSPELKPISASVNNAPSRQPQLFVSPQSVNPQDSFDTLNSNTDPFKQLSAPDLTGLIPDEEREEDVQYVFASEVKKSTSRPITLSPFNSSALKIEEPPKVLAQDRFDKDQEEEEGSFLAAFLPSFLTSSRQKQKPKVAGSLPVTVRDQSGANIGRRPVINSPQQNKNNFPFLGSLFNNVGKGPSPQQRPLRPDVPTQRPLRPNVPAQKTNKFVNDNGFVPVPGRQRSSPVSIPLPGSVEVDNEPSEKIDTNRLGRFAYFKREANEPATLQDELMR